MRVDATSCTSLKVRLVQDEENEEQRDQKHVIKQAYHIAQSPVIILVGKMSSQSR